MSPRPLALVVLAVLALSVQADDKTAEEPISLAAIFENLNTRIQNTTHYVEGMLGVDIPSTQEEVKTVLQDNLNGLKQSAEKIQKKLADYNVTGTTFTSMVDDIQLQVNKTVQDLAHKNPEVGKLLEQVKKGYANLMEVSKGVQQVVQQHADTASDDLKSLAQQARVELSKAATQLEARVQEVLAVNKKPKSN